MNLNGLLHICALTAGMASILPIAHAVSPGEFDDFQDGGDEFWRPLPPGPPMPMSTPNCGVERTLCLSATFNAMNRISLSNVMHWRGSFAAPDIYEIRAKIRNVSALSNVHLRIGVTNGTGSEPGTCYVSSIATTLMPQPATFIDWATDLVPFPIENASMTRVDVGAPCGGIDALSEVLKDVKEVRVLSSESPSWLGDIVKSDAATTIWLDNIRAMSRSQTEWRWIGFLQSGVTSCPSPMPSPALTGVDWQSPELMFGDVATLPSALRNYCAYTFEEGVAVNEAQTVQIERLIGHGLLSAQPDFIAVTSPENVSSRSPGFAGCAQGQCNTDDDDDGIPDYEDNCDTIANPTQCDTNGDGFGNHCDSDIDNNNFVNFFDLVLLKIAFFSNPQTQNWNPDADLDCDDAVNFQDLGTMKSQFFSAPGLSPLQRERGPDGGIGLEATMYNRFADQFNQRAGAPLSPLPTMGTSPPVRLALIDTQSPEVFTEYEGASAHGLTLAKMANRLLCDASLEPDPDCVAELHTQPALSWRCADDIERINQTSTCDRPDEGGIAGLVGGLAESIWNEVRAWRDADAGDRLILNLSLAWNPGLGGLEINKPGSFRQMPVAVQAVYAAIQDAACRGVLPIVAAGNTMNGTIRNDGAVLPAAWSNTPAPGTAPGVVPSCETLLGMDGPGLPPEMDTPLVFAAGGVRFDGSTLFNARDDGEPRIVAYSDHAAFAINAGFGAPPTPTRERFAVLTGSSVAALVASAAATAVWHYNPGLSPKAVMDSVYASGTYLGRYASVGMGAMGVHQIRVCEAAAAAFPGHGILCIGEILLDSAGIKQDLAGFQSVSTILDDLEMVSDPDAVCDGENLFAEDPMTAEPQCPHRQLFSNAAAAGTAPAPCGAACPTCTLANNAGQAFLYIEIDTDYPFELDEPTLVCGENTLAVPIPTPLAAGDRYRLEYSPGDPTSPAAICSDEDKVLMMFSLIPLGGTEGTGRILSDISPVFRVVSP